MPPTTSFNTLYSVNCIRHPCTKDCPDRFPGCGASCEKWAAYIKQREEVYAMRKKQVDNNYNTQSAQKRFAAAPTNKKRSKR